MLLIHYDTIFWGDASSIMDFHVFFCGHMIHAASSSYFGDQGMIPCVSTVLSHEKDHPFAGTQFADNICAVSSKLDSQNPCGCRHGDMATWINSYSNTPFLRGF